MKAHTKESQAITTPQTALQTLKEGNERFIKGKRADRDLLLQIRETSSGQYPFAVILSCIDSRTSSELIFDLGMGDAFNARIAGNFINEDILGSMEFACKVAGAKVVLVLGHTKCGAIKGACDNVELGNLTALISKLRPAVEAVKEPKENRTSSNSDFVENVSSMNVKLTIDAIKKRSSILAEMHAKKEIDIVGGMYSVDTGEVKFY